MRSHNRVARFFKSLYHTLLSFFFLVMGSFLILLPWAGAMRREVVQFIQEEKLFVLLIGIGTFLIGVAIAVYLWTQSFKRVYHLRAGPKAVDLDQELFQQVLERYFQELFPRETVSQNVCLRRHRLLVTAELPKMPEGEEKPLLEKIQEEIEEKLSEDLGFQGELHFSAKFLSVDAE